MIYECYFYANFTFLVDIKIFNHGIDNESSEFFCRPNYTYIINTSSKCCSQLLCLQFWLHNGEYYSYVLQVTSISKSYFYIVISYIVLTVSE